MVERVSAELLWPAIFRSPHAGACDERLLLLESLGIPATLSADDDGWTLRVAPEHAGRAAFELARWSLENRPVPPAPRVQLHRGALPAALFYALLLFVLGAASANSLGGHDWYAAGGLDGARVRAGELWRAATALTLHADLAHYAANAGFGALFGTLAGRVYGAGAAWLTIVLAAVLANLLNAAWMPAGRISIGASTAVFAALGALCVYRWPATGRAGRHGVRVASVVAALVLLALLGTGDAHTDVAAHALGFACGAALGWLHGRRRWSAREQWLAAGCALAAPLLAWAVAFAVGA